MRFINCFLVAALTMISFIFSISLYAQLSTNDSTEIVFPESLRKAAELLDYEKFLFDNSHKLEQDMLFLFSEIDSRVDAGLASIRLEQGSCFDSIDGIVEKLSKDQFSEVRREKCTNILLLANLIDLIYDKKHDFSVVLQNSISIPGVNIPSGTAPGPTFSPEIREEYRKARVENGKLAWERHIQSEIHSIRKTILINSEKHFVNLYSHEPRANNELVELLEKYKYPEIEKIKVFKALSIPLVNFRGWESTDGSFEETAKFVSLDENKVTFERADGSTATIEFSALRELDRDYIRLLMECEEKANETSDDSDVSPTQRSQREETNILPDPAKWFSPPFGTDVLRLTDGSGNVIYPYSTGHPDETRSKTETTRTTVVIPKSQLNVTYESHSSPPPPLYSNRLKIGLTIYAAFIAIVFALYFYLRFRWQRSQSAS